MDSKWTVNVKGMAGLCSGKYNTIMRINKPASNTNTKKC